jgi:hypothetical protein
LHPTLLTGKFTGYLGKNRLKFFENPQTTQVLLGALGMPEILEQGTTGKLRENQVNGSHPNQGK